nr:cation diffusion facilitator family transporter [uncultured Bacillus sp.]
MSTDTFKKVQLVLFVILLANLIVAVLKIVIGSIIQSASMTADGFHSMSDGMSNVVGLIGIRLAMKPKDLDHPYGHNKFETLAGMFISAMLFFVGGKVIYDAMDRFRNPVEPDISMSSLIVMLITLGINIFVSVTEYRKGKELQSPILISDSMHTRSDIYVSIGVLATLIAVKLGMPAFIDPIASLVVSGFIIHAAYEIFRENSDVLVDRSVANSEEIRSLVMSFHQVRDAHKIRSRGSYHACYIDLHILVEPDLSTEESHALVHAIEEIIKEKVNPNAEVLVHVEPYNEQHLDDQ